MLYFPVPRACVQAPISEQEFASSAVTNLENMCRHVDAICHALSLMRLSLEMSDKAWSGEGGNWDDRLMFDAWRNMAAREIVIRIEDFYRSFVAARAMLERSPFVRAHFDMATWKCAHEHFNSRFGKHKEMRDAACHQVDYSAKPHNQEKNSVDGMNEPGFFASGLIMLTANFIGDDYVFTGSGETLRLKLGPHIPNELSKIAEKAYQSIRDPA